MVLQSSTPSTAPVTKSDTWPSPSTAPATQNESHASSLSHMKCHLQCAEQPMSSSKLTKYCACHAKWPPKSWQKLAENSWNIIPKRRTQRLKRNSWKRCKNRVLTFIVFCLVSVLFAHFVRCSCLYRFVSVCSYWFCFVGPLASLYCNPFWMHCFCLEFFPCPVPFSVLPVLISVLCCPCWSYLSRPSCCFCLFSFLGVLFSPSWAFFWPLSKQWAADPRPFRDRSEHEPVSPQQRFPFALRTSVLYWKIQHFALRLSFQISPSSAPTYCACPAKWPSNTWQQFAENSWNVISNAQPIRSRSETVPKPSPSVRNPPRNRGYFSRSGRAFCIGKCNISSLGYFSKF